MPCVIPTGDAKSELLTTWRFINSYNSDHKQSGRHRPVTIWRSFDNDGKYFPVSKINSDL